MPSRIPEIHPPLVSAYFTSIQLLNEQTHLEVATLDERRKKGQENVNANIEQAWNLHASLGQGNTEKPILVIEVYLSVKVSHQESGVSLGSYTSNSRAVFDVVGVVGKITSDEIPSAAIAPYLAIASDRVRNRCHSNFQAMQLPVRIPAPRDFAVMQAISAPGNKAQQKAQKRKKHTKNR